MKYYDSLNVLNIQKKKVGFGTYLGVVFLTAKQSCNLFAPFRQRLHQSCSPKITVSCIEKKCWWKISQGTGTKSPAVKQTPVCWETLKTLQVREVLKSPLFSCWTPIMISLDRQIQKWHGKRMSWWNRCYGFIFSCLEKPLTYITLLDYTMFCSTFMENLVSNQVVGLHQSPVKDFFYFTWENRLYSQVWRLKKNGEAEKVKVQLSAGV